MDDPRWHIEDTDPDIDEAPPGTEEDCTGEDDDDGS
jgi:hypothetical protein